MEDAREPARETWCITDCESLVSSSDASSGRLSLVEARFSVQRGYVGLPTL